MPLPPGLAFRFALAAGVAAVSVIHPDGDAVLVIDREEARVSRVVPIPAMTHPPRAGRLPWDGVDGRPAQRRSIAIDPVGGTIAVTSGGDGTILLLDGTEISTVELPTPARRGRASALGVRWRPRRRPGGPMSAHRAVLDDALARAERHGRPGLPVGGFTLGRAADRSRRGIHRLDGSTVIEPDGHLHRIFPSPDGSRIAVEWAPTADENAVFGLVDVAAGTLRLHPDIRLRYDTVLWAADSRSLDVVASRDRRLVTLDVETGETEVAPLPSEGRLRLFPGGESGLRALSSAGAGNHSDRPGDGDAAGTVVRAVPRLATRHRGARMA
ncbi:hypothetical protein JM654_05285 [Microbacterium oxydans]|nr:hypothetical protein [Microbacterium oxydans]